MAVAFVKAHTVVSEKTLDTSASVTVDTGGIAAGNLIVLAMVFDNAGTASKPVISSITKMSGETNSWALLGAARSASTSIGAFASGEVWAIKTTTAWSAGTYTITLDTAVTQKAAALFEFSGAEATMRSTTGTAYSTTTTAAIATTSGTLAANGDLMLGFIFGSNVAAAQAGDGHGTGGTWNPGIGVGSTGGSAATNNFGVFQYKITPVALVIHPPYNNSAAMTAGNGAIAAILQATPDPTVTQAAYRFYADGTETGATALAAQDTGYTADAATTDVNLAVRVRVQSTNATTLATTDDWQLQWEKNTSGTWAPVANATETYIDGSLASDNSLPITTDYRGQSFIGNGTKLTRARFSLAKAGTPTGNVEARLFAHTGTFGTNSRGVHPILAASTTVKAASTLGTTTAMEDFLFDGSVLLANGTPYVIGVANSAGDASNRVDIRQHSVAATHPGNAVRYYGIWDYSTFDTAFEVYGVPPVTTVVPYDSPSLTDAAATTNRLTGGTGTFTAGKVSEDGLADNVGWAGNNHTELLYAITLKATDLADADTLRFRVVRNGATTGFTYTQVPTITIGGGVPAPPSGTATGGYAFNRTTATGQVDKRATSVGTYAWNRTTATGARAAKGYAGPGSAFNGTFETTIDPWYVAGENPASTLTRDTTQSHSGVASMKLVDGGSTGLQWSEAGNDWYEVMPQGPKACVFWAKAATAQTIQVWPYWGSAPNDWAESAMSLVPISTTWQQYTVYWDQDLPAFTGIYFDQVAANGGSGNTLWLDDITVGPSPPSAYLYTGTAAGSAPAVIMDGTAAGTYTWAGTASGAKPLRGTAAGTYLWARTTATGAVVKRATAAGGYAFNRTTATGQRTPKGTTTGGTYTWTGNATGLAPAVGVKAGTAMGAYVWARTTATGSVTRQGTAAGAYAYAGTAATGTKVQRGTSAGTYAFNLTATTGVRTPKATTSGTYHWAGTGIGQKTPRGAAVGAYAYAGTAAGASVHRGTTSGSYAFNRTTATGAKTQRGTSSGTYLWARTTATGTRTPKATAVGGYAWNRTTGTGYRLPKATSTGTHHWAGTATGIRPIPGVKQGTAQGFYTYTGTGFASTTRRGTSTGGYLYAGTGTGSRTQRGTAAGAYAWAGTAAGVVVRRGTSTGTYLWARTTATGKRTPKAAAAGAYLYAGTATGSTPGVVHYVEDFAGHPAQVWHAGTRLPIQTF